MNQHRGGRNGSSVTSVSTNVASVVDKALVIWKKAKNIPTMLLMPTRMSLTSMYYH